MNLEKLLLTKNKQNRGATIQRTILTIKPQTQ